MVGFGVVRHRRLAKVWNYEDARARARRALPRGVWEYVDGGAEDEVTLRRNVEAFRELRFRPRMGVWVAAPVLETSLFGESLSMPLLIAPCGGLRLVHPDGDIAVARGAAAAGTIHVTSSVSGYPLEEIAKVPGLKWFQLYSLYSRERMESLVDRAQAAGYTAMVVTVDSAVSGKRERDLRNGYTGGMRVNARNAIRRAPQLLPRPAWAIRYVRDGMPFGAANARDMTPDGEPLLLSAIGEGTISLSPTWDDVRWIRETWKRPLLVKGVLTGDDARRAVDLGCEGVIVSNHGGRQLDAAPATLDALPEIVAAVGSSSTVLLDGGVRRGGDVLKAVALGAKAVLVGRPYVWGLAIAGQAGVEHMLALVRSEMCRTMQLMGCEAIEKLDLSWVTDIAHSAPNTFAGDLSVTQRDALLAGMRGDRSH